eukprot:5358476-Amphidinium_carterae.1
MEESQSRSTEHDSTMRDLKSQERTMSDGRVIHITGHRSGMVKGKDHKEYKQKTILDHAEIYEVSRTCLIHRVILKGNLVSNIFLHE